MSIALLLARILLALVFVVAGLAKLADLAGSRQALRDFGVSAVLIGPFGVVLPLVAVALPPAISAWWGDLGRWFCCCCLWPASATIWLVGRTLSWYTFGYPDHREQGILLSPKNTPQSLLLATAYQREEALYLTQR